MIHKTDLWHYFKIQKDFYSIVNPNTNFPLLEEVDDYAQHRLFFSQKDAEAYRKIIIERDSIKPSDLIIYLTNINELFDEKVISGLYGYANQVFDLPLKVTIAMLVEGEVIVEDDILDELLYLN